MNLLKQIKEITTCTPRRTLVSSIIIALLIPVTIFAVTQRWELRREAAPASTTLTYPTDKWQRIWYEYKPEGEYVQGQKPDAYIELPMGAAGDINFDKNDNLIIQDHTWPRVWLINLEKDSSWLVPVSDYVIPPTNPGPIDFYGKKVNVLKIFGQKNFQETSEDTVVANKIYHASGVLVDKSTTPNRIYIVDTGNSRVLGFASLGYCQNNQSIKCTNDLDCPGSTCFIDGKKSAGLIFGQPDASSAACNHDNNLGIYKNPSSDSLCFIHYPETTNTQEYWMRTNIDIDNKGNLYVPDVQNNRILVYNTPFSTDKSGGKGDTIPDFVIGQDDFNLGKINKGMDKETRNNSSIFISRNGDDVSTRGVSVDAAGNVWVADTFNRRVLRFPPGSKNANLVLGQPNFSYSTYSPCYTLPLERPLNQVCHPTLAKVHPQSGDLYVIDEGGNGAFAARILIFRPPFSNGMSASKVIFPKQDGAVEGLDDYHFQATGLTFNTYKIGEYAQGVFWVSELSANRVLLLDNDGNIIKVIGAKDKYHRGCDFGYYGQCKGSDAIFRNFNLCWPGSSIGIDNANNIYLADEEFYRIAIFSLPYNVDNNGCVPDAKGGLFDGTMPNSVGGYKFTSGAVGTFAFDNQLIVSDRERFLVWNDYLDKPMGAKADFVIGQNSEYERIGNEFQLGARAFHTIDDKDRLWTSNTHGKIIVFQLPFNGGDKFLANFVKLYWADTNEEIHYQGWSIAFDKINKKIWVNDWLNNRILRVSNYDDFANKLYVDMVIGQPDKTRTKCNQDQFGNIPSGYLTPGPAKANSLCENYQIEFDNYGNLYVVENNYENHGNSRIVVFTAEDLKKATGLFPNISAKKVFIQDTLTTHAQPRCSGMINQPCSPVSIAFNSRNQMVVGNDGYYANSQERHLKQLWFYDDPLKKGIKYLGSGVDETALEFDNNWGQETLAYGRSNAIQFQSSRKINFPGAGKYRFTVGSDDGVKLWIDNNLKIDKWVDRGYATDSVEVDLAVGDHDFKIDYYENGEDAWVSFSFEKVVGPLAGDLDGDCDVDITDIMMVAAMWNTRGGEEKFNSDYDFDLDDKITIADIMYIAVKWNTKCP